MSVVAPPPVTPPEPDELELLIREARERQLRRRLFGAAAAAIAAAIGLGVYGFALGGASSTAGGAHSRPAAVPGCGPGHVVAFFSAGVASKTILGGISIHNTSRASCRLPVRPKVRLGWPGGTFPLRDTPLPDQQAVTDIGQKPVSVLDPGQWAFASVFWTNWCGKRPPGQPFKLRVTVALLAGRVLASGAHPPSLTFNAPYCYAAGHPSPLQIGRFLTPLPSWLP